MNFWDTYRSFFKISEIENSKLLQYLYFAIILSFLFAFNVFSTNNYSIISSGSSFYGSLANTACPPFFLHCHDVLNFFYFFEGYNQNIFFTFILMLLLAGANFAYKKDWAKAHLMLLITTFIKFLWMFIFTYGLYGNYDYYDTALAIIWLLASEKEYFSKLGFVWFYFLASTIKFDDSWIFANYLRSLVYGSPLLPNSLLMVATNIVIVSQIAGCFLLLSNNKRIQKFAFYFYILFHIYSGFLVLFRYLVISLSAEYILFHEFVVFKIKKISRQTLFGYLFLLFLLLVQLFPIYLTRDYKKTMEGIYYGLYMFHASDQCINTVTENFLDGTKKTYSFEKHNVPFRCDAYYSWYYLKEKCTEDKNISTISWQYFSSVNGHNYDKQVDTDDACSLSYSAYSHNDWLKTKDVSVDIPIYKTGYNQVIGGDMKITTDSIVDDRLLKSLEVFYWSLWILMLVYCFANLLFVTFSKEQD